MPSSRPLLDFFGLFGFFGFLGLLGFLLLSCTIPAGNPLPVRPTSSEPARNIFSSSAASTSESAPDSAPQPVTFTDIIKPHAASSSSIPSDVATERIVDAGMLEIGSVQAPLLLLVFSNYSCEYCRQCTEEFLPRLERELISQGKLRIQTLITPLNKYPNSALEASALHCATKQGKGKEMHAALTTATARTRPALLAIAKNLKADVPVFQSCLADAATKTALEEQQQIIQGLNVTLIPTFVLYEKQPGQDQPYMQSKTITGLPQYPDLRGMIEEAWERQRGQ